jgi:predicted GNAT superfamily acetyltransferase
MTGVRAEYQSLGIGARLKWEQRERALLEGVRFIKWTFEPTKARNAYFNLEKLGASVADYEEDFYGTDYGTAPEVAGEKFGLASDRLFAEWELDSAKVNALAKGETYEERDEPAASVAIVNDWLALVQQNPRAALAEQMRIRVEFEAAFAQGLTARGFRRDAELPCYLLY